MRAILLDRMWPHWLGRSGDSDEEADRRKRHSEETWGLRDRFLGESRGETEDCQVLAARSSVVVVVWWCQQVTEQPPVGRVSSCTVRSHQDQLTPVETPVW